MSPIFPCPRPTAEAELSALRRDLAATDLEHAAITVRRAQIEDEIYAIERVLAIYELITSEPAELASTKPAVHRGALWDCRQRDMVAENGVCRVGQQNASEIVP